VEREPTEVHRRFDARLRAGVSNFQRPRERTEMNKEQKAAVVDEIAEQLKDAEAIFAVDYRGISVPQAAELREKLRDADATFRVVKNRLTLRAVDKAGADELRELFEGPTALTFVHGDAALAAKALNDFARAANVLEFKGGRLGEEVLTVEEIQSIARLPAREVLHGQLVGTIAAPITGLVRGLNQLIAGFALQLQQIVDQGLLPEGEAPPPEEPAAEAEAAPEAEAAAEEEPAAEAEAPSEEAAPADEEAPAEAEPPAAEAEAAPEEEPPAEEEPAPQGEASDETDNEEADASAAADEDAAEA
jgi:large subunit ribosomal protein L10